MKQGGYRRGGELSPSWGLNRAGFTIAETLIVLAVTSALFASAAVLISGRQAKTQFSVAINDARQSIQQVINETASGYYPNNNNFTCTSSGGKPLVSGGGNSQGTNGDCVFLGKTLYFGPANTQNTYTLMSMAGNRLNSADEDVSTIVEAAPVVVSKGVTVNPTASDMNEVKKLQNGLEYMWGGTSGPAQNYAISVMRILDASAANGQSGSNQFALYDYGGAVPGWNSSSTESIVEAMSLATPVRATSAMKICLGSGTTNQSGLITISESLQVKLQIKKGRTCA